MRALRVAVSALRVALAAVLLGGVAWVLSWRILWEGVAGSDTLFHLQLVSWVAASWPGVDWWYRWDAGGLSYREGYPLAAAWLVAALARGSGMQAAEALQVVQFAVSPLCALGLYAFCAWRLRRPLAGLAAGLLYLLNPISWTFLVDWGFFANQVGTVLFMPCLIALDVCFSGWLAGRRDWSWRLSAVAFASLTALIGLLAPSIVWAPLLALLAYAAAATSRAAALRWLFGAWPALALAALVLSAFWALPLQDYLAAVATRAPKPTYSPLLFHLWSPEQVLQLRPPRLAGPDSVYDRASLSPAAWLPAVAGAALAVRDSRLRPLVPLAAFGLLSMTSQVLYAATFGIPLLPFAVHFRVGTLFLQFGVPLLAGAGLFSALPRLLAWLLARLRLAHRRSWRLSAAWLAAAAGLALASADVVLMGQPAAGASHSVAYGTFLDTGDSWHRHLDDPCGSGNLTGSMPCQSQVLSSGFSLPELLEASGGAVYVETGWQFVDPDWNSRDAPAALPVQGLRWTELDPSARALVDGSPAGWESFTYQGGGWSASAAAGARPGAEAVVRVGERVVAARWRLGRGRLFWSGANLLAHAEQTHSQVETDYLASQWRWLLEAGGQQPRAAPLVPIWQGNDELALPLQPSSGPAWVLFKESNLPGWSAALETPSGVRDVGIVTGELDFTLVRLDAVPAGSRLLLRFSPTWRVFLWWALSAAGALVCLAWLVRPGLLGRPAARLRARLSQGWASEDG